MLANIFVAVTNFPVVFPVITACGHGDVVTACVITYVGLASFISHLAENHKHGMAGIGFSREISYFLNRLDVLGCVLTVMRLGYLYYMRYGVGIMDSRMLILFVPIVFLQISEYDKYNPALKNVYILYHSIWHITVYMSIDVFLRDFIYLQ